MKNIFLIAGAVTILAFTACSNKNYNETDIPAPGASKEIQNTNVILQNNAENLPSLNMKDAKGGFTDLRNYKGKKIFVNLWASWCPPCRAELPSIEKLKNSLDPNKAVFLMLSLDDDFEQSKEFIAAQKLDLPIYFPAENLPALFNTPGIPATFIFNENGKLIKRIDGADDYNSKQYRDLMN